MQEHTHRPMPHGCSTWAWTKCVTAGTDAWRAHDESSHGGVICIDTCRCGAERRTEANCGNRQYGPWTQAR